MSVKRLSLYFSFLMYVSSIFVILATAFVEGKGNFLKIATRESGFFESIGAFLLLLMSIVGFMWILKFKNKIDKRLLFAIGLFSFISLLAFLEEISWGQHQLHFKSSEFFQLNNYQKESNLHNLIPAHFFSFIVYFFTYSIFIFIPLFLRFFKTFLSKKFSFFNTIFSFIPPLHVTLMVLFASSFQAYFYDDIGVWLDTFTFLCALICFFFYAFKSKITDKTIWLHFAFIIFCTLLFMYCHNIFRYSNAQYEIREMFIVLASFIYFKYLLKKFEDKMVLAS